MIYWHTLFRCHRLQQARRRSLRPGNVWYNEIRRVLVFKSRIRALLVLRQYGKDHRRLCKAVLKQ